MAAPATTSRVPALARRVWLHADVPQHGHLGDHAPSPRDDVARGHGTRTQPHGRHRRTKGFAGHRRPEREDHSETAERLARESGGPRGCDAARKVNGRKRHIAASAKPKVCADTQGLLLGVLVHAASIQDADGAGGLLRRIKPLCCWLRTVFADSIYSRAAALPACFLPGITLLVIRRIPGMKGFVALPRRWVVERTFGWLGRWRRLSKDHEHLPEVSEAMVTLAMIRLMLHRAAHPNRKRLPAP